MARRDELRDLAILRALTGEEDPMHTSMAIVEDYFLREYEENRREQGFRVPDSSDELRTELEKEIWRYNKNLSDLEGERVNKPMPEYPKDEDDVGFSCPKGVIVETV